MKKEDKLLDAGCGRGDFLIGFKELELNVAGLDREKASPISKDIEVMCCDFENETFPFADHSFDYIFTKSVIEHLHNPENFIRECHRVLKQGGRIILMTPDWISQMKIFFCEYTHRQPYAATSIRDMLKIFCFKDVESELFYQLPIIWRYPALKILSSTIRSFVPVTVKSGNKFIRYSSELMVLGTGTK